MSSEVEEKVSEIKSLLKKKGYKNTITREEVIRVFVEAQDHLKPEEVHQRVKGEGVSLPTVYRCVELLKKTDVIKEINIKDGRFYELHMFSKKKLHIHFQCTQCQKIKEYDDRYIFKEILGQKEYIEENYQDIIDDITIVTKGTCKECNDRHDILPTQMSM